METHEVQISNALFFDGAVGYTLMTPAFEAVVETALRDGTSRFVSIDSSDDFILTIDASRAKSSGYVTKVIHDGYLQDAALRLMEPSNWYPEPTSGSDRGLGEKRVVKCAEFIFTFEIVAYERPTMVDGKPTMKRIDDPREIGLDDFFSRIVELVIAIDPDYID